MTRPKTFGELEQLVLVEVICNARALALGAELEATDFAVPLLRAAFEAVRNVQARGETVELLAVADEMTARLRLTLARRGDRVDDIDQVVALGQLVNATPRYDALERDFPRHVRELRAIAEQRRMLWSSP